MNSRRLRHDITLQTSSETSDGMGGCNVTWADWECFPAEVTPKTYSKTLEAGKVTFSGAYDIVVRYRKEIAIDPGKYRIRYKGRTLSVHSIINENEENRWLHILAYSVI